MTLRIYDYVTSRSNDIGRWYREDSDKSAYRDAWRGAMHPPNADLLRRLIPIPDSAAAAGLPPGSALLSVAFRLLKPYLSKDNADFDILDNPVRKEWVFKAPEVASTSWKGAFRAALDRLGQSRTAPVVVRLVGPPPPSDDNENEELSAGALTFFPTFFDPKDVTLEMINPHDRQRGKGKVPIILECVKAGAEGTLTIIYVPAPGSSPADRGEDLQLLAEGVVALLTVYGFGAKTSSGFGVASDRFGQSTLVVNAAVSPTAAGAAAPADKRLPFLQESGELIDDLRHVDGSLVILEEYRLRVKDRTGKFGRDETALYKRAEKWWGENRNQATAPPAAVSPTWPFATPDELRRAAADIAAQLQAGGEQ